MANPPSTWPLDVLRTCLGFWPLAQRLLAESLSRRWREALSDAALWSELDVPSELFPAVPALLGPRRAPAVRKLRLAAQFGPLEGLPSQLCRCTGLVHLSLTGIRTLELPRREQDLVLPSVRCLVLQHLPYFILSSYSHHTGARSVAVSASWLARTFEGLEELTCDYLQVDGEDAACESLSRTVFFARLRSLSFVAVTRSGEEVPAWNSTNCCCDLPAIASSAPSLERLEIRIPRLHLGRVSRRPGQSVESLSRLCHKFCATSLSRLKGIGSLLPKLQELRIAALKEGSSLDALEAGEDLADFFGLPTNLDEPSCRDLKTPLPALQILAGGEGAAELRRAAGRRTDLVVEEVSEEEAEV